MLRAVMRKPSIVLLLVNPLPTRFSASPQSSRNAREALSLALSDDGLSLSHG